LFIASFLARLAPLGRYVTPDEPAWVYRSIRFYDALAARDWAAVPSTGHPGVTTMWLGAVGVAVQRLLHPAGAAAHLDWIRRLAWLAPENGEAFRHLAFFLPAGRVAVALVATLGLLLLYGSVLRLFDRTTALLMVGFLAFDPFLVGHSGLLHTDGLLATFCALSVVCLLGATRGGPRAWAWSLASGAAGGLAMLTKSSGAFLAPFALAAFGWAWVGRGVRLRRALALAAGWALSGAVLYFALYPAMWAAPVQTARDLLQAPSYHATSALMPTFFAGRTSLYHGPEFYAVALPFRLSPVILIGLVLSVRSFVRRRCVRGEIGYLWLFALGYLALLALNVKKYDRYLLPIFPPLALVAALSLSGVRSSKSPRPLTSPFPRLRVPASPLLLTALQLALLLPFAAHPLTYANPLLGGPVVAARLIALDWGEGMGGAARWLNRLPDADRLTVAAANVPSFASLFAGRTLPLTDDTAALADYLVPASPRPPASLSPHLRAAYTATLTLLPHAVVYTNTAPLEQAAFLARRAGAADTILLDADAPLLRRYEGPGGVASVADLPDEAALAAWLAERVPEGGHLWTVHLPGASPITAAHLRRQVETIAAPVASTTIASATITQYAIRNTQLTTRNSQLAFPALFGGQLALVDGVVREAVAWPDVPEVTLRWLASAPPSADYRALVTLRDGEGHAWSTAGWPVLSEVFFPTSSWAVGEWADETYGLSLPPSIPPGRYSVEVSLYEVETGARLGAAGPEGRFRGTQVVVGEMQVVPPTTPPDPDLVEIARRLDFPAGPLTLLGADPPSEWVLSGDPLPFALFWRADAAPDVDYRLRLRLVGGGEIGLESTVPLSPHPTSRWRAGDLFESRYDLRISPDLSPGRYRLAVNVLDGAGDALWDADRVVAEVEVAPRERSFDLPEVPCPLDLTWGEGVHLRGYGLDRTQAGPGESLLLTLYWQAEGPLERDYTLFVHLLGPDGLPHGQVDRVPGNGLAPTTSWAAGQVIVEEIALPVAADAPPGTYRIAVGFYDVAYGDRLPVTDPSGHFLPDDQALLPIEVAISGGSP